MSKPKKTGGSKKRSDSESLAISFIEEVAMTVQKEYEDWESVAGWASGKTIHLRLLGESSMELVFNNDSVEIKSRLTSESPHLAFALTRKVLTQLIDGELTPSNAVFNGVLRVAGEADDLVLAYNVFEDIIEILNQSEHLQNLYDLFKNTRMKSPTRAFSIRFR